MKRVLILFAHPKYEQSRINRVLIDGVKDMDGVTVQDLYERYPDFNIDVGIEKDLLVQHDVVIWHHPFYWYSCPPLLKQWIDIVLEYGWAYGADGNALVGKTALNVLTAGGTRQVYCMEGKNHYTVVEFLRPFEQTARLCGMDYLPPFGVMGTHRLTDEELEVHVQQYQNLIEALKGDELSVHARDNCQYLNDLPAVQNLLQS